MTSLANGASKQFRRNTPAGEAASISASLELAAERSGDLTADVYARLFAAQPDMQILFWRDGDGAIKAEMLARAFEAILDFIGERHFSSHIFCCEVVTHEGYDVPRDVFATFFSTICASVKAGCGTAWTAAMDDAWGRLITDIKAHLPAAFEAC